MLAPRFAVPLCLLFAVAACGGPEECPEGQESCVEEADDALTFTVVPQPNFGTPVFTSFSPLAAAPGAAVIITGQNFNSDLRPVIGVRFGGVTATYRIVSPTRIDATVPPAAVNGKITLMHAPRGQLQFATPSPSVFTVLPVGPSVLSATTLSQTEVQLRWRDNSNNESGFEVSLDRGAGWVVLGTVPANQTAEPITLLDPGTNYRFRVRARGNNGSFSAFSNIASATTWRVPFVQISGGPSGLRPGVAQVVNAFAIVDTNGDGRVAGAANSSPNNPASLWPAWRGTSCGVEPGGRFAPNANVIAVLEIHTGGVAEPQFVAVHMRIQGSSITMATVTAGDLDASNNDGFGQVLGAPSPPSFSLSGSLPSGSTPGALRGTFSSNVFATLCGTNELLGASVSVNLLDGIPLVGE